jgi:hypothetical protein
MAAPMPATTRPPRIPMDQAFLEAAAHVRNGLEALGIRWTPEAEQDAVSTMLIQAGRSGWLLPWNSPGPLAGSRDSRPPAPIPAMPDPLAGSREARSRTAIPINTGKEAPPLARPEAAAPPPIVPDPPAFRTRQQPASAKSFPVMIRAFHEIEAELPPEVFTTVLAWYGVEVPEQFSPDQTAQAAACYVALKLARDQYRVDQQITTEHFEQTEEGWR